MRLYELVEAQAQKVRASHDGGWLSNENGPFLALRSPHGSAVAAGDSPHRELVPRDALLTGCFPKETVGARKRGVGLMGKR